MDVLGILKEAWGATWREKKLWILGLFVGGSAGASSFNWTSGPGETGGSQGDWDPSQWEADLDIPQEGFEQFGREVEALFTSGAIPDWLPWLIAGIGFLILLGMVFWVLSIAAQGGLIEQTNEALAGRTVSVRQGWRTGFRRWFRVFAVGFLLALPIILLGIVLTLVFGATAFMFIADSSEPIVGLLSLGVLVPFAVIAGIAVGVLIALLQEVAYRHAVLGDQTAVESIKTAWADLFAKRGLVTMWLVMLVVGIGVAVASALVFLPIIVAVGLIVGAAVLGAGLAGLWLLLPLGLVVIALGMVFKAVYSTFSYAAWTEFYRRMIGRDDYPAAEAVQTEPPVLEGAADAA
jgi:MFS family permease